MSVWWCCNENANCLPQGHDGLPRMRHAINQHAPSALLSQWVCYTKCKAVTMTQQETLETDGGGERLAGALLLTSKRTKSKN